VTGECATPIFNHFPDGTIREILMVLTVPVALAMAHIQHQQANIKEMLKNSVARIAGADADLKDFLEVRYGLGYFTSKPYRRDLSFGCPQLVGGIVFILLICTLIGLMLVAALGVQIGCIREISLHPNFSPAIAKLVIAVVIGGDIALLLFVFLTASIQPYQSLEDWNKLTKLADRDPEKVKQILEAIFKQHTSKGWIRRTFGRPKMKRLP
jgi:hypothetical protein